MRWRVINHTGYSAYENMAFDEAIAEAVGSGKVPPTIRFYRWSGNGAVTLGYSQSSSDISLEKCTEKGIPWVRRVTGGMAMYHKNAITYSVAVPYHRFRSGLEFTHTVVGWIISALENIGVQDVKSNLRFSILAKGKKIAGNTRKTSKSKNYSFQHGSIFIDHDYELESEVLRVEEKILKEKVTSLSEQAGIFDYYARFEAEFLRDKEYDLGKLTEWEIGLANELLAQKYAAPEWNNGGNATMGICTITWGSYPHLKEELKEDSPLKGRSIYDIT